MKGLEERENYRWFGQIYDIKNCPYGICVEYRKEKKKEVGSSMLEVVS